MSERGMHPVVWLGLGAAGAWGATHYLAPMLTRPRKAPPAAGAALAEPMPATPTVPATATTATTATEPRPAAARPAGAPGEMSREFDPIFGAFAYGRQIPIAYLRALAWSESRLQPAIPGGLFQIMPTTRADFARRTKQDPGGLILTNPMINTAIGVDTVATIRAALEKNHPRQFNAAPDWSNPRHVELITLAYNAGWSEAAGVGAVLSYLDKRGTFGATIDDIAANARAAGAVDRLADPDRIRYARTVAARFTAERERDTRDKITASYLAAVKAVV